jgi:hypothetical protein
VLRAAQRRTATAVSAAKAELWSPKCGSACCADAVSVGKRRAGVHGRTSTNSAPSHPNAAAAATALCNASTNRHEHVQPDCPYITSGHVQLNVSLCTRTTTHTPPVVARKHMRRHPSARVVQAGRGSTGRTMHGPNFPVYTQSSCMLGSHPPPRASSREASQLVGRANRTSTHPALRTTLPCIALLVAGTLPTRNWATAQLRRNAREDAGCIRLTRHRVGEGGCARTFAVHSIKVPLVSHAVCCATPRCAHASARVSSSRAPNVRLMLLAAAPVLCHGSTAACTMRLRSSTVAPPLCAA